ACCRPMLMLPPGAAADQPWWTHRDREEELVSVVAQLKADRRAGEGVPLDRCAIVVKRTLPYLYLAAETLPAAGVRYQTVDALPLAVEPSAASIDVVLDTVSANFGRGALVALLRSPHFAFADEGT